LKRVAAFCALACAVSIAVASPVQAKAGYYMSNNPPLLTAEKRPIVITIHGGGWKGSIGSRADILMSSYIGQFNNWGYRVYNLAHRSGRYSLIDTLDAVQAVANRNPGRPICMFGGSSGGHLSLMAAIELPDLVDCVIDQAGIPDLVKPDTVPGWQPIHETALRIWGAKGIHKVNPMERVREIRAPVLVIAPDCDQTTSLARQEKLVRKLRRGQLLRQYGGEGYDTGHCEITWDSISAGATAERSFLEQTVG
jgi:dipeptidyl aminopeptidase/acylaminoacyl peptidase